MGQFIVYTIEMEFCELKMDDWLVASNMFYFP